MTKIGKFEINREKWKKSSFLYNWKMQIARIFNNRAI